jgi:hypothetical protein
MIRTRKLRYSNVGLPNNLLAAIGHVTALFAQLEYIVDSKISEALALPGAPKINPRLMVPFNQRLGLLDDLCKQYLTDTDSLRFAAKILADLKQPSGMRNLIVHGAVAHSKQRRKRRVVYWFRRISWENPVRIVERRGLTVKEVEAFAARLSDQCASAGMFEVFFWVVHDTLQGRAAR